MLYHRYLLKTSVTIFIHGITTTYICMQAIDALALEDYAIDTVQPLLSDLMGALTRLTSSANSTDSNNVSLPPDFEALVKLRLWLQKLNEMRAYEELQPVCHVRF
jgi:hypothetical protein